MREVAHVLVRFMSRRLMVVVLLLAALGAVGCGGAAGQGTLEARAPGAGPSRSMLGREFRFRAAIYHRETPRTDAREAFARLAEAAGFVVAAPDGSVKDAAGRTHARLEQPSIAEFAPPNADSLQYFGRGLSAEDGRAVVASRAVTVIEFIGAAASANDEYKKALSIVRDLARELGGYVWDEETRNLFTLESFAPRADAFENGVPNAREHVTLHAYRDDELVRIVSLGMVKFGLPDVAVEQVGVSSSTPMANLVNVICQTLVERPSLEQNGALHLSLDALKNEHAKRAVSDTFGNAKRKLDVTLVPAAPKEGDADNRLLELVFPGDDRQRQERHQAALSQFFGSNDGISRVQHDEKLLAASARAKKKAFALRERFANRPPPVEMLQVKAPFGTPDGHQEWMWVEVITWKGDVIHGILNNDPFDIPTLKAGARVEVRADDIFDYIWTKADGTTEGNETGPILEAMERNQ